MVAPSSVPFTVREYLALEAVVEVRHEFCGGRILAMAGADPAHSYDRGDKWSAYRMIPTLTDYVMVSTRSRELDHHQRQPDGTWTLRTVADHLRSGPRVVGGEGARHEAVTSSLETAVVTLGSGLVLELEQIYRHIG